jgi:Anti-sigma-K factor rskA
VSDDHEIVDGDLLELLEAALDEAPAEPPPDRVAALRARAQAAWTTSTPSPKGRERWLLAAAAAAVALLVGFVVGGAVVDRTSGRTSAGVVEHDGTLAGPEGEASEATLRVVRTGIGRVIELDTDELPVLPTGEYYEVWFVAPDENDSAANRISAGTFHPEPDGRSSVRLAAAVDPAKFPTVEITAEPGDGNPAATGPVVLRATIGG